LDRATVSLLKQGVIVNSSSEPTLVELRIAQAYVKLSSIPEDSAEVSVPLAAIGNCEIRMLRVSEADLDGVPLFWLELFDHGTGTSIDSFRCQKIKEAVPVFEYFMSEAAFWDGPGPDGENEVGP
jgi:hypothetical protein